MINSIKLKIILLFFMSSIVLWAEQATLLAETKPTLLALPVFNQCSCDSATYCLNDEDVIHLHMWYENAKNFTRGEND
jgi:hypothetical protein